MHFFIFVLKLEVLMGRCSSLGMDMVSLGEEILALLQ